MNEANYLHNATESKDHQVLYAHEESKVNHVVEDIEKGIAIHSCKIGEYS